VTNLEETAAADRLPALTGEKRAGRLCVMVWRVKIHADDADVTIHPILYWNNINLTLNGEWVELCLASESVLHATDALRFFVAPATLQIQGEDQRRMFSEEPAVVGLLSCSITLMLIGLSILPWISWLPWLRTTNQEEVVKCQDCLYWQISDRQRDEGACRRHAPKPAHVTSDLSDGALHSVTWPRTKAFEWCGEFRKRDGGQPTVY